MEAQKSVFETLNAINCNDHTETKNGLTYLSWAWAWQIVKQNFPDAFYTIYEGDGIPYFTDGRTCWVKTGVTIRGLEHIEYLPVMDNRNNSIPVDKVTSMDMNKAIQRSLTKACARHGLGLYIYAGEDLPDADPEAEPAPKKTRKKATPAPAPEVPQYKPVAQELYWKIVRAHSAGQRTKTGGSMKQWWIDNTHAGAHEIAQFDHDVEMVTLANNNQ